MDRDGKALVFFSPNPLFEEVSFFTYTFLVFFFFFFLSLTPLFFVYEKNEVESTRGDRWTVD